MQTNRLSHLKAFVCLLAMAGLAACEPGKASLPGLIDTIAEITTGKPLQVVRQPASQPASPPAASQPAASRAPATSAPATPAAATPASSPPAAAPATAPATASGASGVIITTEPLPPPPASASRPPAPQLTAPNAAEPVRIGFLAPLTGPSAAIGQALLDAAQMAIFDLADSRVILVPRDTAGQPDIATRAAQEILAEGVDIIIGPLFSATTAAVAPLARERGVKVLSFSTDRSVAGAGVYVLGFAPEQQVARVVRFATDRGLQRLALLAPDSAYGQAVSSALGEAIPAGKGRLLLQERYPADNPDLTPAVRRFATALRNAALRDAQAHAAAAPAAGEGAPQEGGAAFASQPTPADAILLPEGGAKLRALAPLLPYFDIDPRSVRFLGTGLWDDPGLGTEPALTGGWFAAPAPEGFEEFRKRFEQAFGRRPHRLASLAYDATALAGVLARVVAPAGEGLFADPLLHNADGFAGYDGVFRFMPNGTVERGLAVLEIQRRAARVIDPAPSRFVSPVN